ncbi:disintegrin and metalloproteinase domain-containing protein 10 isoform X2 [Agrilus planipennis]|uniref:ADAM10 endopeptidase n=1 Tax=Agrilus planipennis TaxID=224129 RepID=A0A1W4WE84_AGRPL|nr:disintegrin and metalloproteinase domain-containing protein 10 isoform X2 [Agrilus planipennis]
MLSDLVYIVFILLLVPYIESANRLNEYISHYEPLDYDTWEVHRAHQRAKRSVIRDDAVNVQFKAHNREFRLRLKRDLDVFADKLEVHGPNGKPVHVDTAHIYKGRVIGEPDSVVFGSVIDGVFEGKIVTPKGNFFVEKSYRYFPEHKHPNRTFHSVIYREDHVSDPYENRRAGHGSGCGITDEVSQWMEKVQNAAVEDPPPNSKEKYRKRKKAHDKTKDNKPKEHYNNNTLHDDFVNKYSREANEPYFSRVRRKRATKTREENKNTCSLFIQTDPLIWKHIKEQFPEPTDRQKELERNEKTREEILSLIAHHVTAVNYIYRDTKFDGKFEHRNIKFEVQRIKIDDDTTCHCGPNECEPNQFCLENIDVSNFLNIHSLGNHEDFCLAYVFTYRDFTGGTLGLAWVASASGASGGICEKYKTYTETIHGMYQSTKRSLNTGIITFVNYNSRVPPKVSQLTLAHEIGHNFGSPHDYPPECRPGGLNGNYIMFASATSGDRPNNSKFSSCSIGNISSVLDAIFETKKRNCFSASAGAFCGNKIVEAGEECDCGYDNLECMDSCCYPRIVDPLDKVMNQSAKGCHKRKKAQCSPSQGPCCSGETCTFIPAWRNEVCKTESDCSRSSKCNGLSAECPPPSPRPDKTRCNNGTQLCIKGECSGSICLEWNLTACSLNSKDNPNMDKRKLCELACQNGTDICRSTSEFAHIVGLPPGGISLRPGSPCDNFQGYCDVFLKCRAVDADGPLVRLMNLLLDEETLTNVAQWITEFWWAVVLIGVGFIIFMGLFIKCCAVHTPSSNPKKPPARRLSETLRRPMNTLRRMRHHHGGMHSVNVPGAPGRARSDRPNRPSASQGPRPGYGQGRGQHYIAKASAPPASSRPNNPGLYAGAYDRNAYEMQQQQQQKV